MIKKSIIILLCVFSFTLFAGDVGTTSHWGIVITPCTWCFKTNVPIQVHHKISQAECKRIGRPDLIRNTNNMVCLCRKDGKGCHFYIGHHGISWAYVYTNVDAIIKAGNIILKVKNK